MTKLNYILSGIIIVLTIVILWFIFDKPKSQPVSENEIKMVEAINQLNFRIGLIENFISNELPDKVAEFNEKIQKGEIK